jgi:glutamate/tyrosine decarboxylase-like PLP-dependent enzyme
MSAKQHLSQGIGDIPGIEVIQPSELSILLYKSVDARVDINAVSEALMERGWFVGKSRDPEAIHLALNAVHAPIVDEYLADLRSVVEEVRTSARVGTRGDATY